MRPALEVADILRRCGPQYRQTHANGLSRVQRRVMSAIELCRTAALGGHVERCDACGHQRIAYDSCRNRHCPKCQSLARAQWLERRQAELLPQVEYFHVVFTLPESIAALAYRNKRVLYDMLFRASAGTLRTIAADPKHLGAEIGFITVLHTWGQNLLHHPHVHCVVPGGGISPDGERWIACRPGSFLPVRVLSRLFRRLFLDQLRRAFDAGMLRLHGQLEPLHDARAFTTVTSGSPSNHCATAPCAARATCFALKVCPAASHEPHQVPTMRASCHCTRFRTRLPFPTRQTRPDWCLRSASAPKYLRTAGYGPADAPFPPSLASEPSTKRWKSGCGRPFETSEITPVVIQCP